MFSISCFIALAISSVLIPLIIKFCKRYKLYDSVNARKIHSGEIPRLGGLAFFVAFMISCVVSSQVFKEISGYRLLPLLVSGILIFGTGILDDIKDLPAKYKLLIQMLAAFIVIAGGYRFDGVLRFRLPFWLSITVTFIWIVAIINAFNLIDGLDGLCGGISFIVFLTFGFIFLMMRDQGAGVCFIAASSILGFLIYNWPPAKIFMGDCGSQFLGFLVAVVPLYFSSPDFEYIKGPAMVVIVALPALDVVAAIWRRLREKRPIMSPDKAHIHHKLLNIGFGKKRTLFCLLGIQCLGAISVAFACYLSRSKGVMLLTIVFMFQCAFYSVIHFVNRAVLARIQEND